MALSQMKSFFLSIIIAMQMIEMVFATEIMEKPVNEGGRVILFVGNLRDSDSANEMIWMQIINGKNTTVCRIRRTNRSSPWMHYIEDTATFDIVKERELVIKRMHCSLEGEYWLTRPDLKKRLIGYKVNIPISQAKQVLVMSLTQIYQEKTIPDGVKRQWNISYNVSTACKKDCDKTVDICLVRKQQETRRCDSAEIVHTGHTHDACQFTIEYNDSVNKTIRKGCKFYIQFSSRDTTDGSTKQMFLLTINQTQPITTNPSETTSNVTRKPNATPTQDTNRLRNSSSSTSSLLSPMICAPLIFTVINLTWLNF
ncbi:uncharacterized protein LOC114533922 isoform X1 [Dendronephthya gigantea]|uniref:uncharacterized protein LOC114533922 isoform X1 n=1 Tax=Dendronephthya gigantea TaxID=151771 RepID=UPI00106D0155|nr:uncharacterized protein LOC114533922 isoform X1 [Dendronephthya gigantea]